MKQLMICGAAALCIFASCKKSEEKKLVGVWKATAMASDTNHNGSMDAVERWDESGNNWGYTFKKGGTAEVNMELNTPATWQLNNGILKILAATTKEFKVLTLTNTNMTLEYPDEYGVKQWEELEKQ